MTTADLWTMIGTMLGVVISSIGLYFVWKKYKDKASKERLEELNSVVEASVNGVKEEMNWRAEIEKRVSILEVENRIDRLHMQETLGEIKQMLVKLSDNFTSHIGHS